MSHQSEFCFLFCSFQGFQASLFLECFYFEDNRGLSIVICNKQNKEQSSKVAGFLPDSPGMLALITTQSGRNAMQIRLDCYNIFIYILHTFRLGIRGFFKAWFKMIWSYLLRFPAVLRCSFLGHF